MRPELIISGEGPRPFKCPHCLADFVWGSKLQDHMALQHPPPPKLTLEASFEDPTPSPEPRLSSERSPRLPSRKRKLKAKAPAICPHCSKAFSLAGNLNAHIRRVHLKEEHGRRCAECDAVFGGIGELKKHFERHHLEPGARGLYPCPHCSKSFLAKRSLEDHVNGVHLDLGFKCPFEGCGHSSMTRRHADSHLKTHSKTKEFGCDRCERRYKYEKDLRRHIRKAHALNSEEMEMEWPTIVSVSSLKEEDI